jgi:hypothetical protein
MKNRSEESLLDALQYCSLRKLPEVEDGENVWIRAIARVAKADGQMYYAYVEKDDNMQNKIVKDFGSISAIVRIVDYYPFSYLKPAFMPKFKGNKKEERIAYLTRYNKDLDYSNYSVKELDKLIMLGAIKKQMEQEKRNEE